MPPKTVLETILDWSQNRPAWQRDALRRIVAQGALSELDIEQLAELCKMERSGTGELSTAVPLAPEHIPANPGQEESVSLHAISDVSGANHLAPGQTLAFGPKGLTIVYGDNGAGKSGYGRVLKRACRARHVVNIEPNVYETTPSGPPAASFTFGIGDAPQPPLAWQDNNQPHVVLSAISVFDSSCAAVHVGDKNEVAFRPFGLDVPDELARTCQRVKDALDAELRLLEKARHPMFAKPTWNAATQVGKALAALKPDTDPAALSTLAVLSDTERAHLLQLKEDLAKDPAKAAAQQKVKADRIARLREGLRKMQDAASQEVLALVVEKAATAKAKRDAARLAAEMAFSGEALGGVGAAAWRALWDSARRYSSDVAYRDHEYPFTGQDSRCLLCQQPLEAQARGRLTRFEQYVQQDSERHAKEAEAASETATAELAARQLQTRFWQAVLQDIALADPALARTVRRFVATARLRRYRVCEFRKL